MNTTYGRLSQTVSKCTTWLHASIHSSTQPSAAQSSLPSSFGTVLSYSIQSSINVMPCSTSGTIIIVMACLAMQILEVSILIFIGIIKNIVKIETSRIWLNMPSLYYTLYQMCCKPQNLSGSEQLRVARVMDKNRERMSDH